MFHFLWWEKLQHCSLAPEAAFLHLSWLYLWKTTWEDILTVHGCYAPGKEKGKEYTRNPTQQTKPSKMTACKDSLFCLQSVDFGYIVAGDEAFSLCWKGFSFPPFSMPGTATHRKKCLCPLTPERPQQWSQAFIFGNEGRWERYLELQNPVGKFTAVAKIKICLRTEVKPNSLTTCGSLCSVLHKQELVTMVPNLQKQNVCNSPPPPQGI